MLNEELWLVQHQWATPLNQVGGVVTEHDWPIGVDRITTCTPALCCASASCSFVHSPGTSDPNSTAVNPAKVVTKAWSLPLFTAACTLYSSPHEAAASNRSKKLFSLNRNDRFADNLKAMIETQFETDLTCACALNCQLMGGAACTMSWKRGRTLIIKTSGLACTWLFTCSFWPRNLTMPAQKKLTRGMTVELILDPAARIRQLSDQGSGVVIDKSIPTKRYFRSGSEMERQVRKIWPKCET